MSHDSVPSGDTLWSPLHDGAVRHLTGERVSVIVRNDRNVPVDCYLRPLR